MNGKNNGNIGVLSITVDAMMIKLLSDCCIIAVVVIIILEANYLYQMFVENVIKVFEITENVQMNY